MIQTAIYVGIGVVILLLLLLFFKNFKAEGATNGGEGLKLPLVTDINQAATAEQSLTEANEDALIETADQPPEIITAAEPEIAAAEELQQTTVEEPQTQPEATGDQFAAEPQSQSDVSEPVIEAGADIKDDNNIENLTKTTVFELKDATIVKPIKAIDPPEPVESAIPEINSNLPRNEEELAMIIASKDETLINLYCRAQTIKERNDIVRFARQAQLAEKICAMSADDQEAINSVDNNMVLAILRKARSIEQELLKPDTTEQKNDRDSLSLPTIPFEKENLNQ